MPTLCPDHADELHDGGVFLLVSGLYWRPFMGAILVCPAYRVVAADDVVDKLLIYKEYCWPGVRVER